MKRALHLSSLQYRLLSIKLCKHGCSQRLHTVDGTLNPIFTIYYRVLKTQGKSHFLIYLSESFKWVVLTLAILTNIRDIKLAWDPQARSALQGSSQASSRPQGYLWAGSKCICGVNAVITQSPPLTPVPYRVSNLGFQQHPCLLLVLGPSRIPTSQMTQLPRPDTTHKLYIWHPGSRSRKSMWYLF